MEQSPTVLARKLGVSRQRAEQILHPERHLARSAVKYAVRVGKIVRPTACQECSEPMDYLEAHHPDYKQKLVVRWLCRACHCRIHPHGRRKLI